MADLMEVAAAVLWRGPNILVCKRSGGKSYAGYWEFPGGKKERDETMEETLGRELKEELGVEAVAFSLIDTLKVANAKSPLLLYFFNVEEFKGEPIAKEQQELLWVRPGEALKLNFLPADMEFLQRLAWNHSQ